MRIDAINNVSRLYQATKPKKAAGSENTDTKDKYEVSKYAKDYQTARTAMSSVPEIREDKVARIRDELNSGTYNVSAHEIAEKMVSKYFDSVF